MSTTRSYTVDSILESLGYGDPMIAARQQARMILLGRQARYQVEIQQLEKKWGISLSEMQQKYQQEGVEDFAVDDDYLQGQWYAEAITAIVTQLDVINAA
jgi:hypothetical protein